MLTGEVRRKVDRKKGVHRCPAGQSVAGERTRRLMRAVRVSAVMIGHHRVVRVDFKGREAAGQTARICSIRLHETGVRARVAPSGFILI